MKDLFKNLKAISHLDMHKVPRINVGILGTTGILSLLAISQVAITPKVSAQTTPAYCSILYGIDNTGTAFSKIYNVNVTNATYNAATANTGAAASNTAFLSAAVALEPSTGRLFYVSRDTSNTKVAYWNPVNNTHTQLATTFNAGSTVVRAAFSPSGRLFAATSTNLYEINPTTGAQISNKPLSGVSGANGDMAFDGNNVLFLAADANLYTIDIDNLSVSSPANLLATAPSGTQFNSLGFKPDGKLYAFAGSNSTMYEINTNTGTPTAIGVITFNPATTPGVVGTDYASCAAPIPNLQSTKTYIKLSGSTGSNIIPGDVVEYTITTINTGSVPATQAIFKDPIPTGATYVAGSTKMNGVAVADATGGIFPFANGATIQSPGLKPGVVGTGGAYEITIKYRIKVNTVNPPASITNQGTTLYLGGSTGGVPTDDPNTPIPTDPTVTAITPASFSVSGTLYEDTDGGNDFDSGETTLPANINVKLFDSSNNVVATTTTAANGTYTFSNVTNGNYKIQVDTSDSDIPAGYTLGTPNDTAITVSGANVSNINFGFDSPPAIPSGSTYCQSPYNELYSGQSGNKIFAVHGLTGGTIQLTGSALASTVNSLAADHNNHLVYYAEGTSVYAWDAINNTHITITTNIRSFNSSLPTNSTLLSAGGAAFYNGSLYLGVDPPQAGIFEIYKVNFVPGSNGRTIQSVTPLNINGAGKANGQLNDGDWGDFIISDNGTIYGSSGGTAKYWSFDLNTNTFTDLVDNITQSSQLAKDGTGRLWAFRNGTNSVVQIQIVGNAVQTVGTANSTSSHSSADAGECVTGLSSIGDRVWNDTDGDGVEDAGEGGFANVTVALYRDIDGDGVIDATDPQLAIQTTNADGNYDFTGLIFGNYIVKVTDTNQVLTGKTITTGTNTKAVNLPTGIQDYNNADFGFNQPVASNPKVLLVKRITGINGSSFTNLIDGVKDANSPYYVPEPHDTDDNNTNWPSNYLQGLLNGGKVRPNDEVEYTIYFLSAGDTTANNVVICDLVPENATFIPTAFNNFSTKNTSGLPGGDRGIIWQNNGATESLTNISDRDTAEYLPPGIDPTIKYPGIKCDGSNTNGVVVVKLGNLPNATAPVTTIDYYGFIRFRGRVK
jgi:uncharacterized repeat protein (TIGR01451 family)